MTQEERREKIIALLKEADQPLTGSHLSSLFGVTRQVIVGDVAVLRARGEQIVATPQGYFLYKPASTASHLCTIAVRHGSDRETIAHELNLIVDLGEGAGCDSRASLYGELTANLQLPPGLRLPSLRREWRSSGRASFPFDRRIPPAPHRNPHRRSLRGD